VQDNLFEPESITSDVCERSHGGGGAVNEDGSNAKRRNKLRLEIAVCETR